MKVKFEKLLKKKRKKDRNYSERKKYKTENDLEKKERILARRRKVNGIWRKEDEKLRNDWFKKEKQKKRRYVVCEERKLKERWR